jgi:1-deoxy-D-xylulose-5-phosphate reductoisomerase
MLVPRPLALRTEIRPPRRRVAIVGSTGSIGTSAVEIAARAPDEFEVAALVAGSRAAELADQVLSLNPRKAIIVDQRSLPMLRAKLGASQTASGAGEEEVLEVVSDRSIDLVVAAAVGSRGIGPILAALEAGKTVALANKESLVAAGALVQRAIHRGGGELLPVDSEHSAVFQLIQGEGRSSIRSIVLTASGGPFLELPIEQWAEVTPEQAVRHPRWSMGRKISVDSATMMNKALEVIEAHWLFGLEPQQIEVVVHPQSVVHALVRTTDGALTAHLSNPDMKGPISFAMRYPYGRIEGAVAPLDLTAMGSLEFRQLDGAKFRGPKLALECIRAGGASSAILNAANEWAVERFLGKKLRLSEIYPAIEDALARFAGLPSITELAGLAALEGDVRAYLASSREVQ